ncbi:MAG: GNAT family N-acetyltransferase [Alphaproteobacteria bacterium]|nr:GNAT family N-acetyltransferase [Alphaproteobacteria bacterium]
MAELDYVFRKLDREDLKKAAIVYERAFADDFGEVALKDLLSIKGSFGIAVDQALTGELVAFMIGSCLFEQGEILTIAVDPTHQGKSLGFRLMSDALKYGQVKKVESFLLEVASDNVSAIALYTKLGFQQISTRKGYYRRGSEKIDAYIMRHSYEFK